MPQSRENNVVEQFIGAAIAIGWLLLHFVIGAFIVSKWLTKLLFETVVNRLLRGALDRQDGLVVMVSALMWSLLFVVLYFWLLYPQLDFRTAEEKVQAFWLFLGLGLAWGVAVAGWILLEWWSEAPKIEMAYEPAQMLGEPVKFTAPSSSKEQPSQSSLPAKQELVAELEEVYGNGTGKFNEQVRIDGTSVALG